MFARDVASRSRIESGGDELANEKEAVQEYFTVGELAKKSNVSVRTLQYYDREGLLAPSALSTGGRRLYTYKDMVTLHQIRSLKNLGFSLAEIKEKLLPMENPSEVAAVLGEQAEAVRAEIAALTHTLAKLEKLRQEVLSMDEVDFRCYADIVKNLEMRNNLYWAFKYFDSGTRDWIRAQFDEERGSAFLQEFQRLQDEAVELRHRCVPPDSMQALGLAERFWSLVQQFTGGDPELLNKLLAVHNDASFSDSWGKLESSGYLEEALAAYFAHTGTNPLGGEDDDKTS